jgi:hypothetical protein
MPHARHGSLLCLYRLAREKGFDMRADGDKGFRRVVASPSPVKIVEARAIQAGVLCLCMLWQTLALLLPCRLPHEQMESPRFH